MHVLITGLAGQIGNRLSELLIQSGISHRGIDMVQPAKGVPFLKCDLSCPDDPAVLRAFLEPVTHVVHLAAKMTNAMDMGEQWGEQFETSVISTLNLLEALPDRIHHMGFASSMTVYGLPEIPRVDEGHMTRPGNLYALGKLAAERYLRLYSKISRSPVAILRYSSVYGPGRITHRAVPSMIENALQGIPPAINGSGDTMRDYIFIDDVCHATIKAAKELAEGVFNIGSGEGTTVKHLAEQILKLTGLDMAPCYDRTVKDGYSIYYNIEKMERILNYRPKIDLGTGLERTIRWHRERQRS